MRELSFGKDSEAETVVGVVGVVRSVETLDARGGGSSDEPSVVDTGGCCQGPAQGRRERL